MITHPDLVTVTKLEIDTAPCAAGHRIPDRYTGTRADGIVFYLRYRDYVMNYGVGQQFEAAVADASRRYVFLHEEDSCCALSDFAEVLAGGLVVHQEATSV